MPANAPNRFGQLYVDSINGATCLLTEATCMNFHMLGVVIA